MLEKRNLLCSGSAFKVLQATSAWRNPCIPAPWVGGAWYSHSFCFPKGMEPFLLPQAPSPFSSAPFAGISVPISPQDLVQAVGLPVHYQLMDVQVMGSAPLMDSLENTFSALQG